MTFNHIKKICSRECIIGKLKSNMPFKSGYKLSKGRPKGSGNKVSEDLKKHIADLLAYKTERDFSDLDAMSIYELQRLKNELKKYIHPTMKSVEIDPNPVNADVPKIDLEEFFKFKD